MSVTVVKDVLVVVMFAVNLELVAAARLDFSAVGGGAGSGSGSGAGGGLGGGGVSSTAVAALVAFMHPVFSVATSVGLGVIAGFALGQCLKPPRTRTLANRPALARAVRCVQTLALSASSFWAAKALGLEPLLLCVVAGALAANRQHVTGEEERERLDSVLRASMPLVNVVFFTLAGVGVHLTSVYKSSVVATLLVGARLLALYHAARIGCDAIGAPESHKNVAWMGYVTQAGVALGLVRTAAARFPQWGDEFGALMVATIVMNQLVGPPMFRAAIVSVGESGVDPGPTPNQRATSELDKTLEVPVALSEA
jgi:Kef-type K+ transport system membrane component KefB